MIIGLDIGGTNVDIVVIDNGEIVDINKSAVIKNKLIDSIITPLSKVLSGLKKKEIERIVLSTTIATNTITQDENNPVGLVLEPGPGRKLEFDDSKIYPFFLDGYIDHRGREREPINERQLKEALDHFRGKGLDYGAGIGKFSVRNPKHEHIMSQEMAGNFNYFTTGHRLSGELNYPRRVYTAYLNSSVQHRHKLFVKAVQKIMQKLNLDCPVFVLKADGGCMKLSSSNTFPVETILSGPAASIMGASRHISQEEDCIILDIGGTTTDVSFFAEGVPLFARRGVEIAGYKTLVKGLYTRSIGIGGDSLIEIDEGQIKIGPESVLPAIRGGEGPTPSDALRITGRINEGSYQAAKGAIKPLSEQFGKNLMDTAKIIVREMGRLIKEKVYNYLKGVNSKPVYTIEELLHGKKLKPEKIVVVGGPAAALSLSLDSLFEQDIIVPPYHQVANSLGAALSRVTTELTLTADTARGYLVLGEKSEHKEIPASFGQEQARELLFKTLLKTARNRGFEGSQNDLYLLEEESFNIVRRFYTKGQFLHLKARVKPGLREEFLND